MKNKLTILLLSIFACIIFLLVFHKKKIEIDNIKPSEQTPIVIKKEKSKIIILRKKPQKSLSGSSPSTNNSEIEVKTVVSDNAVITINKENEVEVKHQIFVIEPGVNVFYSPKGFSGGLDLKLIDYQYLGLRVGVEPFGVDFGLSYKMLILGLRNTEVYGAFNLPHSMFLIGMRVNL
jgi:hypothetical protein